MTEEQTLDSNPVLDTSGGGGDETDAFKSLTTLADNLCKQQEEDALELQRQQQQQTRRLRRNKSTRTLHKEADTQESHSPATPHDDTPKQTEPQHIELQVFSGGETESTANTQTPEEVIEESGPNPLPTVSEPYLSEDNLQTHIRRHCKILKQVLGDTCNLPDVQTLTHKYETEVFAPGKVPEREKSGTSVSYL